MPGASDLEFMRLALRLAGRGYGRTSPNPMVGAVLVKQGRIVGQGWHHQAGAPHAEIEAIRDAKRRGAALKGASLYVSLEPCCTSGRTPPCTDAIIGAGIQRVVAGTIDPNPAHAGRGLRLLRRAGLEVVSGVLAREAEALNEAFNHWVVHHTPFVTVKAAMSLDGKIATVSGVSKWITGPAARARGMKLREGADAILVGVNTILVDDPALTLRLPVGQAGQTRVRRLGPRRIVLDALARTPLQSRVIADGQAGFTTVVVSRRAPGERIAALARHVQVWAAPARDGRFDLRWLLRRLGQQEIISLLVEGGGEVNASFLLGGLAQRIAFFYSPKVLGGRAAVKAVSGSGLKAPEDWLWLEQVQWSKVGEDLFMTARVRQ